MFVIPMYRHKYDNSELGARTSVFVQINNYNYDNSSVDNMHHVTVEYVTI